MRKILFIDNAAIKANDGQFHTHIKNGELMRRLINDGFEVFSFQFVDSSPSISTFNLTTNGIKVFPQKKYKIKLFSYIVAYMNLLLLTFRADFIYIYYPNTFKYIIPICVLLRKPYAIYLRGMLGATSNFSKWAYCHANFVIETGQFAETVGCNALLPRPMINYDSADININRKYSFKSGLGSLNILFLGRLDIEKGLIELLEAARILKDNYLNCRFTIVGDGPAANIVKSYVENYYIGNVVDLLGPEYDSEKVKNLYINADIYILPTYHEGFPRTIYEAMTFGTPIITTMVGGIPDLMVPNHNCIEIIPKSTQSIVDAITFVYNNYDKAILCAQNAFQDIIKVMERKSHADTLSQEIENIFNIYN